MTTNLDTPIAPADPTFDILIEALRTDFRRLFPNLRSIEDNCFFFKQHSESGWGKVWMVEEFTFNGNRVIREIALFIENNRVVRRREELHDVPDCFDDPSFELPTDFVKVKFFARPDN